MLVEFSFFCNNSASAAHVYAIAEAFMYKSYNLE